MLFFPIKGSFNCQTSSNTMEGSSDDMRLSYSHVIRVDFPITFGGKAHVLNILKTSPGDFLAPATQISMLLTDAADDTIAFEHFRTVSKRCPALQHNGEMLQDHVEVPNFYCCV